MGIGQMIVFECFRVDIAQQGIEAGRSAFVFGQLVGDVERLGVFGIAVADTADSAQQLALDQTNRAIDHIDRSDQRIEGDGRRFVFLEILARLLQQPGWQPDRVLALLDQADRIIAGRFPAQAGGEILLNLAHGILSVEGADL